jgi:NADPH:quinone reductase-like Zn-dependent oxidoreductase
VKLHAASVNPIDISTRRGLTPVQVRFPHVLGSDGAGTVVTVGARVNHLTSGDTVTLYPASGCGRCELCVTDREHMCVDLRLLGERLYGTYAEYIAVPGRNCFAIPAGLSFEQAAALPVAYITAWRLLIVNAELKPGELVLIRDLGSDATIAALQMAAHISASVIVSTSSDDQTGRARNLGAVHVFDDSSGDFVKQVRNFTAKRGVDVVVDCVGGDQWVQSLACLAKGGRLVTCGATASIHPRTDIRRIFWNDLKIFGSTLGTREDFRQVLNFVKDSGAKPIIDQVFSLKDAASAQQRMAEEKQFGKIILRMGD